MVVVDLNDVKIFATVVESGSFTDAARSLRMPKATVSRRVTRLESALATRLLQRTTRRVALTVAGRHYHASAMRALADLDIVRGTMKTAQSVPRGVLRVAAPTAFVVSMLSPWIAEFLARYEQVSIELLPTDATVDLIGENIDLAFRIGGAPESSLVVRKLAPARRVLVASPRYLATHGTPLSLKDLESHDCIVFGGSMRESSWRFDGQRSRTVRLNVRLAVDDAAAAVTATMTGLGVSLLPFGLVSDPLKSGLLVRLLPREGVDDGDLLAVYASDRHTSAALRAFLEFVANKAADAHR
jgi:DNA-binding transcriptional LysR family regulator